MAAKCAGHAGPYCVALTGQLSDENSRQPGLFVVRVVSLTSDAERVVGVALRGNRDRGNHGVMLNVCPFCAANIEPQEKRPVTTDTRPTAGGDVR